MFAFYSLADVGLKSNESDAKCNSEQLLDHESNHSSRTTLAANWLFKKEDGKQFYLAGRYDLSLHSFQSAVSLGTLCSSFIARDHQILLSNCIACRLKLAILSKDVNQAKYAIDLAKRCIDLDPTWSKAYVRLASACITLRGLLESNDRNFNISNNNNTQEYSLAFTNDVCNALQTAIRYDPSSTIARQMLVNEFYKRDDCGPSTTAEKVHSAATRSDLTKGSESCEASINPADRGSNAVQQSRPEDLRPITSSMRIDTAHTSRAQRSSDDDYVSGIKVEDEVNSYGAMKRNIFDAMIYIKQQMVSWRCWYNQQNSDFQLGVKMLAAILTLYVLLEGRIGFEKSGQHGNYGSGNAYEKYRNQDADVNIQYKNEYEYHDKNISESRTPRWDDLIGLFGGYQFFFIIAGILYVYHQNGIHPLNVVMMMAALNGQRHGGFNTILFNRGDMGGFGGRFPGGRFSIPNFGGFREGRRRPPRW